MLECELEEYGDAIAFSRGFLVRKLSWVGRRSAPDKFYAGNGVIFLVEYKRPGEKETGLSVGQKREIKRLRDVGVQVYVIDTKEEIDAIFKRFKRIPRTPD